MKQWAQRRPCRRTRSHPTLLVQLRGFSKRKDDVPNLAFRAVPGQRKTGIDQELSHSLVIVEQIGFKRGNATRSGDDAKPLEKFRPDAASLMGIGYRKCRFRKACGVSRKVLRHRNNAAIHVRHQRDRIARRERAHDVFDNVADARLSKEPEVTALRREIAVKLTKLLAVLDRRLTQPRGRAVAKHDIDGVR
jgi:hypothetical protein